MLPAALKAQHAYYIHGDPVFSNVIRTNEDQIVMIDMRGQLGKVITTQGDVHYDLSTLKSEVLLMEEIRPTS